ncbi:YetF domain-containing protein [Saliterribacillus persicus]|uniref:Uncharacterized membrane protein YcaP (DUF421 family) n=1 Tax=Saliterribacillus persicus TaxID=930114 RepID=A0A368X896_9BACI|nr:DUF421 domain-containing protein [Saliterribacillus persicus]RCW63929.1 uncharacterized membrane protein YcaP (DUF421 family) [Saliterribacillus persicus]
MEINELLIRIAIGFFVLFILTRISGRKEISQMTFFNFVSAIAIGSITANLVVNSNLSIRNGVLALTGWTIFTLLMDYIDIKSIKGRKVVTGGPIIVIREGRIIEKALRKSRLDLDFLNAMLRQQSIFAIPDVDYAVFETNGTLSVMPKDNQKPVTNKDMNKVRKSNVYSIPTGIISDGKLLVKNLEKLNLDQNWVLGQLKQSEVGYISDVFFAQVQKDGSLFISEKDKKGGN